MKRSDERILTSHSGSLYLPPPHEGGTSTAPPKEPAELRRAVETIVAKQIEVGLDVINNGDVNTGISSTMALSELLNGIETIPLDADHPRFARGMPDRDMEIYHEYYQARAAHTPPRLDDATNYTKVVTGPVSSKSTAGLERDVQTLKDAAQGKDADDLFVCFISPGWARNISWNEHYATDEEEYFAIAAALRPFYKAIVDAGVIVQIDAPDLVDTWTLDRWDDVAGYRKNLEMKVEALNTAIEGLPEELVRLHFCWGSWAGPHSGALPLEHVLDIIYRVRAQCYSLEAAKPNHTHEWRVFEDHKLPEGKIVMPGVIDHTTPVIEHPQVISDRLVQYAKLVGKENVIAGTDCGMRIDSRVEWSKLQAMVDGAELATNQLFS